MFCTNLAWAIDDDAIKRTSRTPYILRIKWIGIGTGKFKGMGVLEFADAATALKAVELKNETEVLGRTMYRGPRQPKPKSKDRSSAQGQAGRAYKLYCGNLS